MNFDWIAEEQRIRPKLTALFDEEARLELDALEDADLSRIRELTLKYFRRLGDAGYFSFRVEPDARDETMPMVAAQDVQAEISGSLYLAAETSARLFGGLVAGFGSTDLKNALLEPILQGEMIAAVALSEPEDPDAGEGPATTGILEGEDYEVTGRKSYATNAPIADHIAVSGEVGGRPAVFIVEPDSKGVSLGARYRTLGYNGLTVSSVDLQAVRVPRTRVLGPFDDPSHLDFLTTMQDLILTIGSVGLMRRTVAAAKEYAMSHKRGGRPVIRFQENRFKLAEMQTMSQASQLLAYRAAWLYSEDDREAATVLHCAKVFSAESSEAVAARAVQIMAGRGYISGNPAERAYRESKFAAIAGTTSEPARMSIADALLKRYQV
jgi:alkylation response protein AidB-like acyl-CoA dehydrogenase